MAWKQSPKELTDLLEDRLKDIHCQKRKMFGFPAYFINGNMFSGTFEENIFLRLSEDDRDNIKKENQNAVSFEPTKGRPMKEYMVIPDTIYKDDKKFSIWIDKSIEYVLGLPLKRRKSN